MLYDLFIFVCFLHKSDCARYLSLLLFLTSTDAVLNNSDWCLPEPLNDQHWEKKSPLLDTFFLFFSPSLYCSVFCLFFLWRAHQVVIKSPSHPTITSCHLWFPPRCSLSSPSLSYLGLSPGPFPVAQDEFDLKPFQQTAQSAFYGTRHSKEKGKETERRISLAEKSPTRWHSLLLFSPVSDQGSLIISMPLRLFPLLLVA